MYNGLPSFRLIGWHEACRPCDSKSGRQSSAHNLSHLIRTPMLELVGTEHVKRDQLIGDLAIEAAAASISTALIRVTALLSLSFLAW